MNESSLVLYEVQQSVATITLNRPESLNAMTSGLMKDLANALARVEADKSVRVAVITGSGRGFCAGAELAGQASAKPSDPEPDGKVDDYFNGAMRAIYNSSVPTVARVNGAAAGLSLIHL